jgi:oligoendopeptidase F
MFTKKQSQKKDQANDIIDQIPTWDLRDFYSGIDDINIKKDLEEIAKKTIIFCQEYRDRVAKLDAEKLAQAIATYENICESGSKLTSYSYLVYSSDLSKEKNIAFNQNINEEISKHESQLVFFTIELNEISEERINELLKDPSLKKYQPFLRDVSIFKKHQ